MASSTIALRVECTNLRAEVFVNGIPVAMTTPLTASPLAIPVNQFVSTGANALSVVLHAGPVPSTSSAKWSRSAAAIIYEGPGSLSLRVGEYSRSQSVLSDEVSPLASLDWQGQADDVPQTLDRDFVVETVLGPWTWQSAPQLFGLSEELRSEILQYVMSLYRLLASRRFEEFIAESETKLRDIAAAYSASPARISADMLRALSANSQPPNVLQLLQTDLLDVRLVGRGRLAEVVYADRSLPLQYKNTDDGSLFFLPLILGRNEGRWRVLR